MRISGITIPDNKKISFSLPYIFGIGHAMALTILNNVKVDPDKKSKDLTPDEENLIRKEIENLGLKIEGDLNREIQQNIKRHKDIKTYRGIRHMRHMPVRGQRTKTNSRTVRGNKRVTMGSGRKKAE
jgi:small subunit ribosomal protein S13